jgi:hypothetical protein
MADMLHGVQDGRVLKGFIRAVGVFLVVMLGVLVAKDRLGNPSAAPQPPAGTNLMLIALANHGFARSGRVQNTFFVPRKPSLGGHYVIYWREENLLLRFPSEPVAPEAVTMPSLVIRKSWKLDVQNLRPPGDRALATSTYAETWEWALHAMCDAVADGRMHVLSLKP